MELRYFVTYLSNDPRINLSQFFSTRILSSLVKTIFTVLFVSSNT